MFTRRSHQLFRPSTVAVIALTAAALAGGSLVGSGAAQAQAPSKTVVKCVNIKTGVARVIKPHGKCRKGEKRVVVAATPGVKTCATGGACVLGDVGPGGGKVFYDAGSAQPWGRYLEAAPVNWNAGGAEPFAQWCNVTGGSLPAAVGLTPGSGEANTNAMLTACASGAAVLARAYTGGGQNDWYLPSLDEVTTMTTSRGGKADVGLGQAAYYWTSSQALTATEAWALDYRGNRVTLAKNLEALVRPIRAF
jgi:hypothetical protein